MSERPTPETDALFYRHGYPVEVDSSKAMQLCEKLEQERDWITEKFKLLEGCFKRAERERDEAQAQIKELIYIADRAIALAEKDFWFSFTGRLIGLENDKFGVVSELRGDLEKIKEVLK